ncbi:MAG TPA: hypothetical protein HA230_02180 [Candidatus Aenigmarchaeota archaeon]|nr:hypothetical protein [Candidatus Aenigmarchaeota archaeon]
MAKYQELSPKALSMASAIFGVVFWIVGVIWHGAMAQPSMMGYMYPRFSFITPMNSIALLIVLVVAFYISGWLIAYFYNWSLKRK